MNMDPLPNRTEVNIAFIRTPKFLRKLISPSAAELYALFREKRYMLMKSKKIKTQDAFFFYRMEHLKEDLVKPNSTNTVKKLLDDLIEYNLIETQIKNYPFNVKYYRLN